MDKRIGEITDNAVKWPETTISGVPYGRTGASLLMLGNGLFSVIDTFIDKEKLNTLVLEVQTVADKHKRPIAPSKPVSDK